jgi:xanthine phosphoribosyltransferase
MELLKQKIIDSAEVLPGGVLKVDSFLNHQIDVTFVSKLAEEWYRLFKEERITKILTIESAGIGLASITALLFKVPVVYAKKTRNAALGDEYLSTKVISYTHGQSYDVFLAKNLINKDDRILILDDFLANGSALKVLIQLAEMGGAEVVGTTVAIEKSYLGGGDDIRALGYRLESLVKIKALNDKEIVFED